MIDIKITLEEFCELITCRNADIYVYDIGQEDSIDMDSGEMDKKEENLFVIAKNQTRIVGYFLKEKFANANVEVISIEKDRINAFIVLDDIEVDNGN